MILKVSVNYISQSPPVVKPKKRNTFVMPKAPPLDLKKQLTGVVKVSNPA
jgi:hypothetical protein